jgi:hypothetical protein
MQSWSRHLKKKCTLCVCIGDRAERGTPPAARHRAASTAALAVLDRAGSVDRQLVWVVRGAARICPTLGPDTRAALGEGLGRDIAASSSSCSRFSSALRAAASCLLRSSSSLFACACRCACTPMWWFVCDQKCLMRGACVFCPLSMQVADGPSQPCLGLGAFPRSTPVCVLCVLVRLLLSLILGRCLAFSAVCGHCSLCMTAHATARCRRCKSRRPILPHGHDILLGPPMHYAFALCSLGLFIHNAPWPHGRGPLWRREHGAGVGCWMRNGCCRRCRAFAEPQRAHVAALRPPSK